MPPLTSAQLQAIRDLWDATDHFAESEELTGEEQERLIAARDAMGNAFPFTHPIYVEVSVTDDRDQT